ncbi:MAG: tRNA pseudouridine(55) synthase TruB [Bacteroidota bacterium]
MQANDYEAGQVLLFDKPYGWTSFDLVRKVRGIIRIRKIGHAGTLDPLATGLMILCTGKFTKRINEFMGQEKEYVAEMTLGAITPTYDLESEPVQFKPWETISLDQLEAVLQRFRGPILQIPPAHSAIKVGGKRVYELARAGKEVKLDPRPVTIHELVCVSKEENRIVLRVVCSTGTYIRSLVNDIGQSLGSGAYLSGLVRTRIGEQKLSDARQIESFAQEIRG